MNTEDIVSKVNQYALSLRGVISLLVKGVDIKTLEIDKEAGLILQGLPKLEKEEEGLFFLTNQDHVFLGNKRVDFLVENGNLLYARDHKSNKYRKFLNSLVSSKLGELIYMFKDKQGREYTNSGDQGLFTRVYGEKSIFFGGETKFTLDKTQMPTYGGHKSLSFITKLSLDTNYYLLDHSSKQKIFDIDYTVVDYNLIIDNKSLHFKVGGSTLFINLDAWMFIEPIFIICTVGDGFTSITVCNESLTETEFVSKDNDVFIDLLLENDLNRFTLGDENESLIGGLHQFRMMFINSTAMNHETLEVSKLGIPNLLFEEILRIEA